jgi:AcrR family transcriptional regulator
LGVSDSVTDNRTAEKRRRILEAAWRLVLRQGLRATTMEALAREAGIAKATLYAQFADKDAVIAGVIDDILGDLERAFGAGLAGAGGVAGRIGAALAGKYGLILRALEGSPHAEEIFNEHYRFAARFTILDARVEAEIADELARGGAKIAPDLARIVIAAADGIARKLAEPKEIDSAIRLMCRRLIEPELEN